MDGGIQEIMSTTLMIALMIFYAGIAVAALVERNYWRSLYFVAAILISIAVLGMSNKKG